VRARLLAAAAALVVVVNAVVLAGVAWNRTGEPDARLTLTERELRLERDERREENSGVSLVLVTNDLRTALDEPWRHPGEAWRHPGEAWLDARTLAALGFDVRPLPEDDGDEPARRYGRQPERRGYVVLQLGGSAWAAWEARAAGTVAAVEREVAAGKATADQLARQREWLARERRTASRLFPVAAGPDAAALRQAWPDRASFLVLPAAFGVSYAYRERARPAERYQVEGAFRLLTGELQVPRRLQGALPRQALRHVDDREHAPRFEVILATGRRLEPWIEAVRPLAPAR